MLSLLAMIFTLRLGLGATPVDAAVVSLRNEAMAVVTQQAAQPAPEAAAPGVTLGLVDAPVRRVLTRQDWMNMLTDALSNETIANAAMWIASQPVQVSVTGQKVFVSLRIATP